MQEYFDNEHFSDQEEEKNTFEIDVQWTKPIKKAPESIREISKNLLDPQIE